MNEFENNVFFWQKIDTLILSSEITIKRPKGSVHPKYATLVYPVDYGYFSDTMEVDPDEFSMFLGTDGTKKADAIVICADILKKDIEIKVLIGCTEEEEQKILRFLNCTDFQKTVVIRRGTSIPVWAEEEQ